MNLEFDRKDLVSKLGLLIQSGRELKNIAFCPGIFNEKIIHLAKDYKGMPIDDIIHEGMIGGTSKDDAVRVECTYGSIDNILEDIDVKSIKIIGIRIHTDNLRQLNMPIYVLADGVHEEIIPCGHRKPWSVDPGFTDVITDLYLDNATLVSWKILPNILMSMMFYYV